MKKLFPLAAAAALLALSSSSAAAQTSRYQFDNFDTREGVRVETPAPAPSVKTAKRERTTKGRVRLTARNTEAGAERVGAYLKDEIRIEPAAETPSAALMAAGKSLDGFSTGSRLVDSLIVESGQRHGVDPVLLYAIMHQESSFKQRAMSHKGARGYMQLMPATARRFGVTDIYDPRQNIDAGAKYVRWLLNFFGGDVRLALAGYNAGEGAVLKYGRRIPPYSETQDYVRRIFRRYSLMRDPQTARVAPRVTPAQVAKIKAADQQFTGSLYERNVYAVRMPDGKLRLVSQ
ncbi:MAG TPA: lytic transglycosylase domain-containing protein [Pyrinomonadaceae bacterium]|nr:lytic transglycosylase domain-containing protein [Pyrinomonadaceae bacterium]